jgi:hypothetical protein
MPDTISTKPASQPVSPRLPTRAEEALARMDEALAALRLQRDRIRATQGSQEKRRETALEDAT